MSVPIASVNKYNGPEPGQNDVRIARESPVVQPKSKPCPMQKATNDDFGLGILPPDVAHHPAAFALIDNINHQPFAIIAPLFRPVNLDRKCQPTDFVGLLNASQQSSDTSRYFGHRVCYIKLGIV